MHCFAAVSKAVVCRAAAVFLPRAEEELSVLAQMQHMRRISHRRLEIVGDHDHRDAHLPVDPLDQFVHIDRHKRIQSGDRFVQKDHFPGRA